MDRRDFLRTAAARSGGRGDAARRRRGPAVLHPGSLHGRPSRLRLHGRHPEVARLRVRVLQPRQHVPQPARVARQLRRQHAPEFITCTHEEIAAAMAHGYAKIEGRPALVAVHGTVGTQHASMAVYDAFCDRVPVYLILGNHADTVGRRSVVTWSHSAQDAAAMIRDYIKWDDAPASLPHFAESAVRAYKIAMTPPMAPVAIVADAELQEHGDCRRRRRCASRSSRQPAPPAGRRRRRRRNGEAACRRRESGARGRPDGAHTGRTGTSGRARRAPAGLRRRSQRADELSRPAIRSISRTAAPLRSPTPTSSSASRCATSPARDRGGRARSASASRPTICSRAATTRSFSDTRKRISRWPRTPRRRCRRSSRRSGD